MSAEILRRAKELQASSEALLKSYQKLQEDIIAAKRRALDARDDRGILQIAVDSYVEAEETNIEIQAALGDVIELSADLLRELGEVK